MSYTESDSDGAGDDLNDAKGSTSKKLKFGAFQSMGLSGPVLKGILRRGYRLATPIQRKAIPHILAGKDIVGMSRTGSGKTAAFLVPMFEKLKHHLPGSGPRALIISPTRDLALQTARFVKELGKYTDLRTAVIIGGDRIEDQFTTLHSEPDILLVTPGRLLHVMIEMEMKLSSVNYLVFDEADRLFELGFESQVSEILTRTSVDRQTLLFSATLPSVVADFVAAGLHNPVLVRLDVDNKLSPQLTLCHLMCSSSDKVPVLVHLLKYMNDGKDRKKSAAVFCATRYHVDYLHAILTRCGILSTYAYSSMDPTARKINMAKFRMQQAGVLLVTDVAARGIDVPELDVVINFNFPPKPKLFIHRVGRVARAGRCGTAYSLISSDELSYLFDLHLFLGNKVVCASEDGPPPNGDKTVVEIGSVPRSVIDVCSDLVTRLCPTDDPEIHPMIKTVDNATTKYNRLRPAPSPEAVKTAKKMVVNGIPPIHSVFASVKLSGDAFVNRIRGYKPKEAFVALTSTATKQICQVMAKVKESRQAGIALRKRSLESTNYQETLKNDSEKNAKLLAKNGDSVALKPTAGEKSKKRAKINHENEYFVPYMPKGGNRSESELRLSGRNNDSIAAATLDIADDERLTNRRSLQNEGDKRLVRVWHRQAKKFVTIDLATKADGTKCRVKTESGRWIPASYKTKKYEQWKRKNLDAVEVDGTVASSKGLLAVPKKKDWRNKRKFKGNTNQKNNVQKKSYGKSKGKAR